MINFIRNYFIHIALTLLVLVFGVFILKLKMVKKSVTCKVYSHNITSDKYGTPKYNTIFNCDDNIFRSKRGLNYYVKPIGYETKVEFLEF